MTDEYRSQRDREVTVRHAVLGAIVVEAALRVSHG
jgi:hypothetical protein